MVCQISMSFATSLLNGYKKMKHLLIRFLNKLLRFEHIIYCATNCKIELLLHKKYYEHRRKKYDSYIQEKNYLQSISSKI